MAVCRGSTARIKAHLGGGARRTARLASVGKGRQAVSTQQRTNQLETYQSDSVPQDDVDQRRASVETQGGSQLQLHPKRQRSLDAPLAPQQLTGALRNASSTAQLLGICKRHGPSFNHIHACAALHRLALLESAGQAADDEEASSRAGTPVSSWDEEQQRQQQQERWRSNSHASTSSVPWQQRQQQQGRGYRGYPADSHDNSHPPGQSYTPSRNQIVRMVRGLVSVLLHFCDQLDGRAVAIASDALSRLSYSDSELLRRLEDRALELMPWPDAAVTSARQLAPGGRRSGRTAASGRGSVQQGPPSAGPGSGSASDSADGARAAAQPMSPFDLQSTFAALVSLGHTPQRAWLDSMATCALPHLPALAASPPRLSVLLASLGNTGYRPSGPWLRAACAAAEPHLASYDAVQLRAMAAGLSAMRHLPDDSWVASYLAVSATQLAGATPHDLVTTLGSLAALGCRPSEQWLERFYERTVAVVGVAGGLSGPQAASILAALSRLNCRPTGPWLNTLLLGTRRSLADASAQQLTDLIASLARLRFRPPETWLAHYYTASFQRLPFYTPQQCCAAAEAISRLGRPPAALWLAEFGRLLGGKLPLMSGGQQAEAVAALAELGYAPGDTWLASYEQHSNGKLSSCSAEQMARLLGALARMGFKPQVSWLYSFIMAAYGKLDAFDATGLSAVFAHLPALTPHGSWLDEIIQICAAEAAMGPRNASAATQAAAVGEEAAEAAGAGQMERVQLAAGAGLAGYSLREARQQWAAEQQQQQQEEQAAGLAASVLASEAEAKQAAVVPAAAEAAALQVAPGLEVFSAARVLGLGGSMDFDLESLDLAAELGVVDGLGAPGTAGEAAAREPRPLELLAPPVRPRELPPPGHTIAIASEVIPKAGTALPPASPYTNGNTNGNGSAARPPLFSEVQLASVPAAAAAVASGGAASANGRAEPARARARAGGSRGPSGNGNGGGGGPDGGGGPGGSGGAPASDGADAPGPSPVALQERPARWRVPVPALATAAASVPIQPPRSAAGAAPPADALAALLGAAGSASQQPAAGTSLRPRAPPGAPSGSRGAAASQPHPHPHPDPQQDASQSLPRPHPQSPQALASHGPQQPTSLGTLTQAAPTTYTSATSPYLSGFGEELRMSLPCAADEPHVQYLDAESLGRLIGPYDGPPGPDFVACRTRRAARGAGGGLPFLLGRVWANEPGGPDGPPSMAPAPSG